MDQNKEKTEICVSCGVDTKIPVSKHVDERLTYVCGVGQLCIKCFKRIQYCYEEE